MTIRRRLDSWLSWLPWYRREAREADLARELRDHLELEAEEQRATGLSTEEAAHAAHRALGNTLRIEEDVRAAWGFRWVEMLLVDLRFGLRVLRKSPGFTVVAVLTLALGIGANAAMFSVLDAVLLRPLPYKNPGRLVWLTEALANQPDSNVSWLDMQDWKQQNHVFQGIAGYHDSGFIVGSRNPQYLRGRYVSAGYFELMGVPPLLGQTFTAVENRPGGPPVVVLSHSLWMTRFGGNPEVIGRTVTIDKKALTIQAVMPAGFGAATHTKLWAPLEQTIPKSNLTERQYSWGMYAVARLRDAVSFEQARTEILSISERLEREYPKTTGGLAVLLPLTRRIVGDVRPALLILSIAVLFVLLIACANIASLLLIKGIGRQREITLRLVLGAGKWRLFRQLIVENGLLGVLGGGAGLLLAFGGTKLLATLLPSNFPLANRISVDRSVLLFTVGVSLLAGLLCGLAPMFLALRMSLGGSLKSGSHQVQGGRHRAHRVFVVAEIALASVLLIGAGLMMRSLAELSRVAPGFDTHHLLTESVLSGGAFTLSHQQVALTFDRAAREVQRVPGVASAAAVLPAPFSAMALRDEVALTYLAIKGYRLRTDRPLLVHCVEITPEYFQVMRIPLVEGRTFTAADTDKSFPVAIISEALARRYWPGQDPVGTKIKLFTQDFGDPSEKALTIVGVVGAVRAGGLGVGIRGNVYVPVDQQPTGYMTIVVRSRMAPLSLARSVESAIHKVMPDSPVYRVHSMDEMVQASEGTRRLTLRLLGVFSFGALLLAALGLYGVVSYVVSQSTNEIGVRMALGAQYSHIMRSFLGKGMRLAVYGIAVGLASGLALTRLMSSQLYGVTATDPFTFAVVGALLAAITVLACYFPARRAMRLDPLVALRYE